MNLCDKINSKGFYNGWHAQELFKQSIQKGSTMADCFILSIQNSVAYSVPAKAVKATSKYITYQFLDNSTVRLSYEH
jgi:hypothetical protein